LWCARICVCLYTYVTWKEARWCVVNDRPVLYYTTAIRRVVWHVFFFRVGKKEFTTQRYYIIIVVRCNVIFLFIIFFSCIKCLVIITTKNVLVGLIGYYISILFLRYSVMSCLQFIIIYPNYENCSGNHCKTLNNMYGY